LHVTGGGRFTSGDDSGVTKSANMVVSFKFIRIDEKRLGFIKKKIRANGKFVLAKEKHIQYNSRCR
jgi:hypothetical protein